MICYGRQEQESKLNRLKLLTVIIVLLDIFVFFYARGTPQYSLYQFRKAVENHETDTALKYIDADSIVYNFRIDLLRAQDKKQTANKIKSFGDHLTDDLITMILPAIKETLKGKYNTAIKIPSVNKSSVTNNQKHDLYDYDSITKVKIAIMTRKDNDNLKFKMAQSSDGHWRIVQLMMPDAMNNLQ
jgi:hypothetical protein